LGGEAATLCLTAGGAVSTGDGMGRAAASCAVSIRGARARVMRVGAHGGGLCVSREKEEGKRRREKRKEEKEKGKKEKERGRKKRVRERAAVGGIRGDGRPHAAVTAGMIEHAWRSGDTQCNTRDEEKKEKGWQLISVLDGAMPGRTLGD